MIQDILPRIYHTDYTIALPRPEDTVLLFYDNKLIVHDDETFITYEEISSFYAPGQLRFLFSIDKQQFFMVREEALAQDIFSTLPKNCHELSHRALRTLPEMHQSFAAYTGWHLQNWYHENRFCGCCGHPMTDGTDERKVVCPSCGHAVYPRINPCIIVAVYDDEDRLLMTKYAGRSVTWFVLVAGFTEIGETAEDTVRREVLEETGVHVRDIRYFGSQPWGIPGNLTLGYTARLDGSHDISLDTSELAEARWIPREEIDPVHDELSITAAMITAFKKGEF